MSESTKTPTPADVASKTDSGKPANTDSPEPPAPKEPAGADIKLPDDHPLVTAYAAQKDEIKALKDQRSEAEKVADRLASVEKRAAEAEARVLRRDIALDHKLTKDDAALLDTITDEGAMKSLAQRLASDSGSKHGNYVPREGNNPRPGKSGSSWGPVLQGLDRQRQG